MNTKIEPDRATVGNTSSCGTATVSSKIALKKQKNDKKQGYQRKRWCFTWNNYHNSDLEQIERFFRLFTSKGTYQEEKGENGTKHIQGVFSLKEKKRLTELKKLISDEVHFEATNNWEASVKYCQKEETRNGKIFVHNLPKPRKPLIIIKHDKLYPWQLKILNIVEKEPDDRKIYWYWESKGGIGKSTFCRYLVHHHDAIILGNKSSDMKYAISKLEEESEYPELIIIDIPRTAQGFVSYGGIEEVKNALFFSSKYESRMVMGNPPHLIIFANFSPDLEKLSKDRWIITNLSPDSERGGDFLSSEEEGESCWF